MQPAQYGTTPCDRGAKYDPQDEQQVQPQDRSCQGGIHAICSYAAFFCAALHFAQRALFAALIRARPAADIVRLPVFIVLLVLAFAEFSERNLAQRAFCASETFLRAAADKVRRGPLDSPRGNEVLFVPASGAKAAIA